MNQKMAQKVIKVEQRKIIKKFCRKLYLNERGREGGKVKQCQENNKTIEPCVHIKVVINSYFLIQGIFHKWQNHLLKSWRKILLLL